MIIHPKLFRMSSSEDESAVQNILIRSKRSERTPLEVEVTELVSAKIIAQDTSVSIPALQLSLKQDLRTQNRLLNEAIESENSLQAVVKIITKFNDGELTMDLSKDEHKSAQKMIDTHVSVKLCYLILDIDRQKTCIISLKRFLNST